MYLYRKFALSGEKILLVRTEVHGKLSDSDSFFNAYAMNEWCPRTPLTNRWRARLGNSVGEGEKVKRSLDMRWQTI